MFHKIHINGLQPGMFVVDSGVSWLKHPYLYSVEGPVSSEKKIEEIQSAGFLEAFIDLTRCLPGSLPPELAGLVLPGAAVAEGDSGNSFIVPPPKVHLLEEIQNARNIYRDSMHHARQLMDNMRLGKFDMPAAEPIVDTIMQSVDRNADALLGLCKLRQTDDYTYTHCVNVAVLAVIFARGLGADERQLHAIGMGGLFHDLGKALIPLRILNAPRKLSDEEFNVMRRHPSLGNEQLSGVPGVPTEVLQVILEHHEKHNGQGYPNGLAGDRISFAGRVAAIADVYDALSSRRVYKDPMPLNKALSLMYSMREKEFATNMLEHFIRLMGVYPVGSGVELDNGTRAVVSLGNPAAPLCPKVILVSDARGTRLPKNEIDLSEQGQPAITRTLTPKELGVDPGVALGLPLKL